MEGKPLEYQNFTVYPEYCGLSSDYLMDMSNLAFNYQVAALEVNSQIVVFIFHNGKVIHSRRKFRLHESEVGRGLRPGLIKPKIVNLDGRNILILICYEIMFPEDYLPIKEKVDLIIHMIGHPMLDENQREGWVALQRSLSLVYNCPVVCCCGGEEGRMNITGVIEGGKHVV